METLWQALATLPNESVIVMFIALAVAFGFEFINGFHDTANAVTTVIYTRTLPATPAVVYSGVMNFLGVLIGGTAVAFGIVHLLPVDLLIEASSKRALAMTLALLIGGILWNLGTWYVGLPVSSSHTLIGSILGVALTNSLMLTGTTEGVNWKKAQEVGLSLLVSPLFGFAAAALLLTLMKLVFKDERLYRPPEGNDQPPWWIRLVLVITCGGVSFAHGSNDGQKGMGLILLVLIGFLAGHYALDVNHPDKVQQVYAAVNGIEQMLEANGGGTAEAKAQAAKVRSTLEGKKSFLEIPPEERWEARASMYRLTQMVDKLQLAPAQQTEMKAHRKEMIDSVEFVPFWVVVGVALALGIGTMIGYKRIVITVAEKIGKTHLTYAQGAAAELVAMSTILVANTLGLPVSTTHVLSSGVAGTMYANRSGIQSATVKRIGLAWLLTLPASMAISGLLFALIHMLIL